jgi:uncharacterized membrane protein YdjX (TVP38/TMEM64 family)
MLLELHVLIERFIAILAAGGPWVFFLAMALLPAVGFPLSVCSLAAGPVFGQQMGMGWVVACGLAASTVNILLTYWLARYALRPHLERLMKKWGHRLPKVEGGDTTDLIVLVRVTPGIPFFVQNYVLGLADAPLGKYLVISCAVNWTYTAAMIVFGDAILHGKGKMISIAIATVIVAVVLTHFIRRHFARGKLPHVATTSG